MPTTTNFIFDINYIANQCNKTINRSKRPKTRKKEMSLFTDNIILKNLQTFISRIYRMSEFIDIPDQNTRSNCTSIL